MERLLSNSPWCVRRLSATADVNHWRSMYFTLGRSLHGRRKSINSRRIDRRTVSRDFISDNNAATCPISHCDFIDRFLPSSAARFVLLRRAPSSLSSFEIVSGELIGTPLSRSLAPCMAQLFNSVLYLIVVLGRN